MKWMNESYFESIFVIFDKKHPFCQFWTPFWALFLSDQYQWYPDYWIELSFELNKQSFFYWIIFWIESWVTQYWIKYWMNHFLSKFKHWIESDRVSNTPMTAGPLCSGANKQTSNKERFTQRMDGRRLGWPICLIRLFSNMRTMQRLICSIFKLTSSSLHRIQNSECCGKRRLFFS